MIEPKWINDPSHWPPPLRALDGQMYTTCLRLFLDENTRKKVFKLQQDIVEAFEGKLLLFLCKLSRMVFEDHRNEPSSIIELTRMIPNSNWTILEARSGLEYQEQYWLMQRLRLTNLPETRMDVVVESTEVIIAFKFVVVDMEKIAEPQQEKKQVIEPERDYVDLAVDEDRTEETYIAHEDDEFVEKIRVLRLDLSDSLQPIYAFLPTLTKCFKFVVQGDFILSTSRESVMENSPWNRMLLDKIPAMFVDAVVLMALRAWRDSGLVKSGLSVDDDGEISVLDQLKSYKDRRCRLEILPSDVLGLIPLSSEHLPISLQGCLTEIYGLLRRKEFLLSCDGTLSTPSQLCAVHQLNFEPTVNNIVPADFFYVATGKRFILHTQEFELRDDIGKLLKIDNFSQNDIIRCLEYISAHAQDVITKTGDGTAAAAFVWEDMIARCFLALALMINQSKSQSRSTFGSRIHSSAADSAWKCSLSPSDIKKLSKLKLWSLEGYDEFECLEGKALFIKESTGREFSERQRNCFAEFKDQLLIMNEAVFDFAEKMIPNHGRQLLVDFFVTHFKSTDSQTLSLKRKGVAEAASTVTAIQLLSPEMVLNSIVLPAFKDMIRMMQTRGGDGYNLTQKERVKFSAYLAFYYLTEDTKANSSKKSTLSSLLSVGDGVAGRDGPALAIPTLSAVRGVTIDGKECVHWSKSKARVSHGSSSATSTIDQEIHLGLEFSDCAISELDISKQSPSVTTFLCAVEWTIVDPLLAVFALTPEYWSSTDILTDFTDSDGKRSIDYRSQLSKLPLSELHKWKAFLTRLGVVDFYGVYNNENSGYHQAPQLYRFIGHLLRDASVVRTSWTDNPDRKMSSSSLIRNSWFCNEYKDNLTDSGQGDEVVAPYVPLFLPFYLVDDFGQPALSVSYDSYYVLQEIAYLVVSKYGDSSPRGYLNDLHSKSWLPMSLHPALSMDNLYLVAAPRDFFAGVGSNPWVLNVHGVYTLDPSIFQLNSQAAHGDDVLYTGRSSVSGGGKRTRPIISSQFEQLIKVLNLRKNSAYGALSMFMMTRYIEWMSQQCNADRPIMANISFMESLYSGVYHAVCDDREDEKDNLDRFSNKVVSTDAACIWIPISPSKVTALSNEIHFPGKMCRPSDLVLLDNSGLTEQHVDLTEGSTSIDVYSRYYNRNFFAVENVCNVCLIMEGSCGVLGNAASNGHKGNFIAYSITIAYSYAYDYLIVLLLRLYLRGR